MTLVGVMLSWGSASAMPVGGLAAAAHESSAEIQNVRVVCGPYRCWWQPNYYYWGPRYRYWGRPYAYRWGYRRWW
jgi:hypothetical protein